MDRKDNYMEELYRERYSQKDEGPRSLYALQSLRWMIARGILPKDRGARILDLGCGTGLMYFTLKKLGFKKVDGTDREKFFPEVIQGDIEKGLPMKAGTYDVILARDVIEHMRNPDLFFKECRRLLKKGGRVVILTPATEKMTVGEFYHGYDHHSPFTKESLVEGLRIFGFINVKARYFRNIPWLWRHTLRAFDVTFSKRKCYVLAVGYR